MTGGLVGQSEHLILPSVPPLITMILTLLSVLVRQLRFIKKTITIGVLVTQESGDSRFIDL